MKKTTLYLSFLFLIVSSVAYSQVLVADDTQLPNSMTIAQRLDDSAMLQMDSENKGFLITRNTIKDIEQTTSSELPTGSNTTSGMITYDVSEDKFYLKVDADWTAMFP
ncbi:MAG: hypothetical protein H6604_03330 [Flavobacteriales bacterium]|nr:hypothetical protein [Flavobacteriales bacterium]